LLVSWSIGCGGAPDDTDVCRRAAAHVDACGGGGLVASAAGSDCDPAAARDLLALDCAQIGSGLGSLKQDAIGDALRTLACDAGLIRYCDAPACDASAYPVPSTVCADYEAIAGCGGCQYYACREAAHACGPRGYYLGYAEKYCVRFLQALRPRMSPAGQAFLDRGRDCLIDFVERELLADEACDDVKRGAFFSHVACYHDNGFCELPLADRWKLLNAVDPADVEWLTALRTGLGCL
jgi:hypothetical protein